MSYEIWLAQDDAKSLCPACTTHDHKTGSASETEVHTVISFLVQNEGKAIRVIDGHQAQHLKSQGYSFFDRK